MNHAQTNNIKTNFREFWHKIKLPDKTNPYRFGEGIHYKNFHSGLDLSGKEVDI